MTQSLAEMIRQRPTALQETLQDLGPIEAVKFREIGANGADSYEVTYRNGSFSWGIGLDKDGKIATFGTRRLTRPGN
jgi:hypothetical protein